MTYLLDVNVLLAFGYKDHVHHPRIKHWLRHLQLREPDVLRLATCSITELGFVRVSAGRPKLAPNVAAACSNLRYLKRHMPFIFFSDGLNAERVPHWVQKPNQTTDGHLLELAAFHRATLATLDTGIPNALLIPPFFESENSVSEPPPPSYRTAA